jgi:hypothetical protein
VRRKKQRRYVFGSKGINWLTMKKKHRWWSSCKHPEYQRKRFDWINEKENGGGVVNQQTLGVKFSSKPIKGIYLPFHSFTH